MLNCPMCKKRLRGLERECSTCRTDVSLLVDYVQNLQEGLVRADALTKAGELGEAVWAYLEVLEVDPDNATARRMVGQVVTAVRQFDRAAPGRRWLKKMQRQTRFRRWVAQRNENGDTGLLGFSLWLLLVLAAGLFGYFLGTQPVQTPAVPSQSTPAEKPAE